MPSRRSVLTIATGTAAALAGCAGLATTGDGPEPTATPAGESFVTRLAGPESTRHLFDGTDVATVGEVNTAQGGPYLPVTLTETATTSVSETFREAGVADDPDEFEVTLSFGSDERSRFGVSPGLADAIASGEWDGELRLTVATETKAEKLRDAVTDDERG
ncbi:hypothetical protein [Halorarius halobius]|uniref:hypothetical protein n=1 Tax=Halorarius halobius TaxID=2962671 RepID=UPI0020CCF54B|nr:hypothetical protein [Halorarius halobius]